MLALVACLATAMAGAPFAGSYEATDSGEPMTLELHVEGTSVRGTLIVDNIDGPLVGRKKGRAITGQVTVMEEPARFMLHKRRPEAHALGARWVSYRRVPPP